jgi:hypothetical protein
MISPHHLHRQLISLAIAKAADVDPALVIKKIEVGDRSVIISSDRKRVVLDYGLNTGFKVGSFSWSCHVNRVEELPPNDRVEGLPSNDRVEVLPPNDHIGKQDSKRSTAHRFVWFALVIAGAAGIAWGSLFYWLVGDWMKLVIGLFVAGCLFVTAFLLARTALRSFG